MTYREKGRWVAVSLGIGIVSGILYDCGLSGTSSALFVISILFFFVGAVA